MTDLGSNTRQKEAVRDQRTAATRLIGALASNLNAVGSIGIFALMCLICADVGMRYLMNTPIPGVGEIVEVSIVAIVFAQLADTVARDRLTRADTLIEALRISRPRVARGIDLVAALAGIALMAILVYGVVPEIIRDYERGYYVGTFGVFTFPAWPNKVVVVFGLILTGLVLVVVALRALLGIRPPEPRDQ